MRYIVRVVLTAESEVDIEVDAAEDEDPTDLTPTEESKAKSLAPMRANWVVDWTRSRVIEP